MEVKYIHHDDKRIRILKDCHMHPTSGHMGVKRTLSRIIDRFMWAGVTRYVEQLV